jgi:hypothetical protein
MGQALRPLLGIEARLYLEKLARINAMLDERGLSLDDAPPIAVVREAKLVVRLFDAIGLVDTEFGPMMRIEEDVLDLERTADMREAVRADLNQALKALQFGPAPA